MKLILCTACGDIRKLSYDTVCQCGKAYGAYTSDGVNATYGGSAIPLFIDNNSLASAVRRWRAQDARAYGIRFTAGVSGQKSASFLPDEVARPK
jgi:hypothetical protein